MPGIDIRVAWAVQVEPHYLAAHVEAFVETLPAVNALRLCHKFGRGPKAFINRLPKDVIVELESWIVCPAQAKNLREALRQFNCFRDKCKPIEHYTMFEQKDAFRSFFGEEFSENRPYTQPLTMKEKGRLNKVIAKDTFLRYHGLWEEEQDWEGEPDLDPWQHTHEHRRDCWTTKVGDGDQSTASPLSTHNDLLRKHFGLELWVSHKHMIDKNKKAHHTTVAYLILPSELAVKEVWRPQEFEDEGADAEGYYDLIEYEPRPQVFNMSYDRAFALPKPLTAVQKRQFARMTKKLALKLPHQTEVEYLAAQKSDVEDIEEALQSKVRDGTEPMVKVLVSDEEDKHRYDYW